MRKICVLVHHEKAVGWKENTSIKYNASLNQIAPC